MKMKKENLYLLFLFLLFSHFPTPSNSIDSEFSFQEKLVFDPSYPIEPAEIKKFPHIIGSPASYGIPYDDLFLTTKDGVRIHGWFLKQTENEKAPTFILFHGNYGHVGLTLPRARWLYDQGMNVLVIDYRGYGRSEGTPSEAGVYMDADAALDFVLGKQQSSSSSSSSNSNSNANNNNANAISKQQKGKSSSSSSSSSSKSNFVFVMGHSMGGAVAIDLAKRRGNELAGLVVENTFTSLREAAEDTYAVFRLFRWLVKAIQRISMNNISKVGSLELPVLFLCGLRDENIKPRHSSRLYEKRKRMWIGDE
ncbi:GE18197, related [Eimeria tenella]|uniref:GE18197, related n=1 Tax=Eimeria tenella TaxID=5802 RepID=U6L213_EIMTE|nr:GE18197, related [Eimeria tenella]CDJ42639.1 GE18197, related [Eimeria tenella]|eukprot:XP_013233389.1 GE18197, related [Eimeria tenella]